MSSQRRSDIGHDEAQELIPWFVNGTLADAARARVSAHVDSCLPCRRTLQRERRLLSLMAPEPASDSAIEAGFRKLMRRIEKDARSKARRLMLPEQSQAHSTWVYAVSMAVALGVAIWLATPRESALDDTNRIDVVFAAGTSVAVREDVLRAISARVTAGPSADGRYTLELTGAAPSEEAVARALERLRNDPRVELAERPRRQVPDP